MKDEVLIEHQKIIDGFGQLDGYVYYCPLDTHCGICDTPFTLAPRFQKYMLEVKGIPLKMLQGGAVYCTNCRRRRSRINWLRSGEKWRTEADGEEELRRLQDEEQNLKARSQRRYQDAAWPYKQPFFERFKKFFTRLRRG